MKGGTDACAGIKGIDKSHQGCQNVVPFKHLGTKILPAGVEHIAGHGNNLSDNDKSLNFFKVLRVIKEGVEQRAENQKIPADVKDDKEFIERNQIIQRTVNGVASFRRDEVLGNKVHHKIENPAAQQLYMGKARFIQPPQREPAVVNRLFLHSSLPRVEYFWDKSAWKHWDRARPYAREAMSRSP